MSGHLEECDITSSMMSPHLPCVINHLHTFTLRRHLRLSGDIASLTSDILTLSHDVILPAWRCHSSCPADGTLTDLTPSFNGAVMPPWLPRDRVQPTSLLPSGWSSTRTVSQVWRRCCRRWGSQRLGRLGGCAEALGPGGRGPGAAEEEGGVLARLAHSSGRLPRLSSQTSLSYFPRRPRRALRPNPPWA